MDIAQEKTTFIEALLPQTAIHGWSDEALKEAAKACHFDEGKVALLFPQGLDEMIEYTGLMFDEKMVQAFSKEALNAMKVRERIFELTKMRLTLAAPFKESLRQAATYFANPLKAPIGLKSLYHTVDTIWRLAGDTSTDYNFYTKRTLLSGIFSATVVVWLNDASADHEESWEFLKRRIDDVLSLPKAFSQMPEHLKAFSTIFNPFKKKD